MRVTKIMREYIFKRVSEAYPLPPERELYNEFCDRAKQAEVYISDRFNEFCESIIGQVAERYGIDPELMQRSYSGVTINTYGSELRKNAEKAEHRRAEAIQNKADDILVNLELGATRAELDEMLSDICF